MTPVFLDTSGLIALLHFPDPHHERAVGLAATFSAGRRPRVITSAVLGGLGDGFARKKRWDIFSSFLGALLSDPLVTVHPVDGELIKRAKSLRDARPDKDWGLTDSVSFIVMTDQGLSEALTADHHFQLAGFRALLLETPD